MLYLSRLMLNLRQRDTQFELADCNQLHGRIMSAFPVVPMGISAREHFGVLYRLELLDDPTLARLLVQSNISPDWSTLPAGYLASVSDGRDNPAVRSIEEEIGRVRPGMRLRFRLRANPTKRVSDRNSEQEVKWHGKRIELRRPTDQIVWIERKASDSGFRLLQVEVGDEVAIPDMRISDGPKQHGRRSSAGQRLSFGVALFEGRLEVIDTARFVETLCAGIGSAKAYGFGLLSIATLPGSAP